MSRSHNSKRNKCQKHIAQRRANHAAAAVPLVQATHAAHSVHSIVPEAALLRPISTQAVDASPVSAVPSQSSVSVTDAQLHVPQPPEPTNSSALTTVNTKRCVRTVFYNTLSKYSHVPRYLKEPLRFERNVKPVSIEGRRLVCFFSEEEEPPLSLPAENLTLAADTDKKEELQPKDLNQDCIKTTLISSGLAVCEDAVDEKIVTLAHENHMINMLPKPAAPPQYFTHAKKVDTTSAASSANSKTNNAEILTAKCKPQIPQELPKLVASPQDFTKQENVAVPSATSSPEAAVPLKGLSEEKSLMKPSTHFITNPKIALSYESNVLQMQTGALPSPNSAHEKESNNTSSCLPTNQSKIDRIIAATPCKTNTTIKTEQIASPQHAPEAIKVNLLLADSAVDLIALDVNNRAPKPKTKKAAKNQSRGQKRASLAKAAKVRQT
ncbi:hypothetical protein HDU78_006345 [Chytriomyces hyalinus]|nr:hypothetical protein HDU78_006345 [Chytriomyces hyalinus]